LLSAQVHVRGYTKKDGTYVAPHTRSSPNGTKADNYSTKGNVNPYTGKQGTKNINSGSTVSPRGDVPSGPAPAASRAIPTNPDNKVVTVSQMPDGTRVTNIFNAATLELEYSSTNHPSLAKPSQELSSSSTNSPSKK